MKERPILFSAPMVRAILDGSKTQTRRVVKKRSGDDAIVFQDCGDGWWPYRSDDSQSAVCADGCEYPYSSPYGQPGDRLWVKETWKAWMAHSCAIDACDCADVWIEYVADGKSRRFNIPDEWSMPKAAQRGKAVTPLFMPRWASRIALEVKNVRVERLQDCSESDAHAEGVAIEERHKIGYCAGADGPPSIRAYRELWDTINGPGSWDKNPWVWVVEFRRIEDGSSQGKERPT